ncbi:hypothetical protein ABIB06_000249 [Bradyrhizobium sp. LB8.2]
MKLAKQNFVTADFFRAHTLLDSDGRIARNDRIRLDVVHYDGPRRNNRPPPHFNAAQYDRTISYPHIVFYPNMTFRIFSQSSIASDPWSIANKHPQRAIIMVSSADDAHLVRYQYTVSDTSTALDSAKSSDVDIFTYGQTNRSPNESTDADMKVVAHPYISTKCKHSFEIRIKHLGQPPLSSDACHLT